MKKIPGYYKLITCLTAGICTAFFLVRIGNRFLAAWVPMPAVMVISACLFLSALGYGIYWASRKSEDPARSLARLASWQGVIRCVIAMDLIMIAVQGFYQLLFFVHLGSLDLPFSSLSGEELTWAYFGHYNGGFVYFIGIVQLVGSLLLLFSRTKLLGVFVLFPVMVAIVTINYFFDMERAETLQAIELLIVLLYLLLAERKRISDFFFRQSAAIPSISLQSPRTKNLLRLATLLVPVLLVLHFGNPDLNPSLTGSYQVSHLAINDQNKQTAGCTDSLLTRVYLDLGNFCVFEFNSQDRRLFGQYRLSDDQKKISIAWYFPKNVHDTLTGVLSKDAAGKTISIDGKMGADSVRITLAKRK